tara:strand:- start:7297 stop:7629 length:333 start_codon:yes stop_codon:yes gene_type:complete
MFLKYLCPPAFLYLCFSLTHVIIDLFNNYYNTAITKFIVMIIYTLALNILCENGLIIIAWILVFIPFVLMSILISLLLFVFGFSPKTGKINNYYNNKQEIVCENEKCNFK